MRATDLVEQTLDPLEPLFAPLAVGRVDLDALEELFEHPTGLLRQPVDLEILRPVPDRGPQTRSEGKRAPRAWTDPLERGMKRAQSSMRDPGAMKAPAEMSTLIKSLSHASDPRSRLGKREGRGTDLPGVARTD